MSHTRAFRTWMQRLESGTLTTSLVRQFAAAISTVASGEDPQGKRTALTPDESTALFGRIKASPVALSSEDTQKGLAWFRAHASQPQSAGGLGMSAYLREIVLDRFDRFSFDGEYVVEGTNVWPVWTINLKDVTLSNLVRADQLLYYAVPWQARTVEVYSDYWWKGER